ncbi:response regulator [Pseudomonas sp. ABC1]|uniref:response regulator n=1 Tax=Pseudomonas sp. ABC1 TaxID=2748080 RepID=UPI0015C2D06C|nr:response regulator [Pseudomonas sp. ABC1]QLF92255.1 response regulator [Pseudomonas sp. ABC1]
MLKDLGIRTRLLVLTLLPGTLLAVAIGGYFSWLQLAQMHQQLDERGQLIARQLAPLVASPIAQGHDWRLQRILNQVLDHPDVRAVAILDPERVLKVHAGPNMLTPPPPSDPQDLTHVSSLDTTRILMPIQARHLHLEDDIRGDDVRLIGWLDLELSHHATLVRGYRSLFTSLLLIVAGLIITALLALRMGRSISQPLQRIKHAVGQLKEGHLETRLPALGGHELDELASGINRMAESLLSAREELQQSIDQATEDVQQNLETIEIQNIELDMARKEALEASRIKSEFLANMSHEIRTPLNGILGFTHLLQKSDLTPRQQDYLGTIEKSADNLLAIINEILDFSKIEAGKLVLENIPFNLRDLIEDTLTILAPAAHEKRLELVSLVYRDTPLSLIGDPLRLRQVLTNLVSNAIKFTSQGSITVRAMLEEEDSDSAQLRISVQDTGIGLTEQDIRALFQAFSQADNSLSRQPGGTGLGLVISRRLIEQMGGEIGVDSILEEGSEFWIRLTLPKARDDIEDLPHMELLGRRVALFETHPLTRQALQHQLESCGLQVSVHDSLEQLQQQLTSEYEREQSIGIAILGITQQDTTPHQLYQSLQEIVELDCKCIVLCPTTEQARYHEILPESHTHIQLQSKPTATRKLQQTLLEFCCSQQAISGPAATGDGHQARLLCVDDNPANLMLVETLLNDMGAQVVAVDSGRKALDVMRQQSFDMVLMDIQMPGMDGRQTTEAIRQWEQTSGARTTPVVALTAHAMASEKRALLQSGLDDYVTKPISERQLGQIVLKWTGLSLRPQSGKAVDTPKPRNETRVLDPQEGLRLAAGKPELAADMLKMLLDSLEDEQQAIRQARQANDRQTLLERVHRLHGATRYSGVPQLRNACQRAEILLKQDHYSVDIALDELDSAITRLQQAARPQS